MSKMNFAMLLVGAGIGSAVTWFCVKKKYEQIAQEEIDSVKEVYRKKYGDDADMESDNVIEESEAEEISEYKEKIEELGYNNNEETSNDESESDAPYIIAIDEFGEDENYDTATLYYYEDGILADADDEIIDDISKTVGDESLACLDNEDCIYVRNNRLKMEYEIIKDLRTYEDATQNIMRPRED